MKGDEFKMEDIEFGKGSVPVKIAARVYGKDACWVRAGIINWVFKNWNCYKERTRNSEY